MQVVRTSHLHNISSSSYSHKVGAATNVYAENLSTEQRTQMMSSPRITSVQGYLKRYLNCFEHRIEVLEYG